MYLAVKDTSCAYWLSSCPAYIIPVQYNSLLLQFASLPQVEQLLAIFNASYEHTDIRNKAEHRHPFIVLEGLDGSGNTHEDE
jgi:hypothetical protein